MAENSSDQEKTEQPTAKKRADAKKDGQVPRSRELNTTLMLMAGSIALISMGEGMGQSLTKLMTSGLTLDRNQIFETGSMLTVMSDSLLGAFTMLLPFILLLVVVAIFSPALLGGFSFSGKALVPKFSKLDPIKGMKKLFSANGLMELVKALLKVLLIGTVSVIIIWSQIDTLMGLGNLSFKELFARSAEIVGWTFLFISSSLIILALIDAPFQIWQNTKKLRMTKQEIKDENKNAEGDPELKGKIRAMQQEMAMRRMMQEVPKADVIVTNPTHYAVAIKYDDQSMSAPRLLAKGHDEVAARIREIAEENNIPLFEAPPLARAIYFTTDLEQEIPAALYQAVAMVLAYIFQLRVAAEHALDLPVAPDDLPVPDDLANGKKQKK